MRSDQRGTDSASPSPCGSRPAPAQAPLPTHTRISARARAHTHRDGTDAANWRVALGWEWDHDRCDQVPLANKDDIGARVHTQSGTHRQNSTDTCDAVEEHCHVAAFRQGTTQRAIPKRELSCVRACECAVRNATYHDSCCGQESTGRARDRRLVALPPTAAGTCSGIHQKSSTLRRNRKSFCVRKGSHRQHRFCGRGSH